MEFEKTQIQTLIIIGALDECPGKEPASALLSILSRFLHKIPFVESSQLTLDVNMERWDIPSV